MAGFVQVPAPEPGSLCHRREGVGETAMDGDGEVVLPAGYVSEDVELGYAGTVFSAQSRTVATAHALVGVGMTREALYVAATRAREANRLYVDVEPEPPALTWPMAKPSA